MKNIRFLGASGTVTGSSFLLTGKKETRLLIDFGMFQGPKDIEDQNKLPLSFDSNSIDAVLLTHAHLDHCGRLPLLYKNGYQKNIYATKPTIDITTISLFDTANIASYENRDNPLFTKEDVKTTSAQFKDVSYEKPFTIGEFTIIFHDAGHILGSSFIEIFDTEGKRIVISGDIGNYPQDLIKPTSFIHKADVVVLESTYGDRVHKKEDVNKILQSEINTIEENDAVLLIPAFSIERTQEIIHRIFHLKKENKIDNDTPVYIDSPMAIEVTNVMKHYRPLFNDELNKDHDPFSFPHLFFTKTNEQSDGIQKKDGKKIIIAGSGMMSGGRILKHLKRYASDSSTHILIVGYQAVETLGRKIQNKVSEITIDAQTIPLNAGVTTIESLSSHADQPKLINWLEKIKNVKKIFLVHGEDKVRLILKEKIAQRLSIEDIILPSKNEEFSIS